MSHNFFPADYCLLIFSAFSIEMHEIILFLLVKYDYILLFNRYSNQVIMSGSKTLFDKIRENRMACRQANHIDINCI